ncbi:SGNH/GDSL hydrolase family protein [bacterium]|nr:SGNH/GDSL hydrolase family protein [bacterium]
MKKLLIITILIMTTIINQTASAEKLNSQKLFSRAVVDAGNSARIKRVFEKAKRGEKITIGVIGGSITAGACASKPENRWGNLIAKWWEKKFPESEINFVNAGIGATDSLYGALRIQEDLLKYAPDFVVVEYSVNDPNLKLYAETLEGIIRQTLNSPKKPAVMLLFTMNQNGHNAQEWHSKVGLHYNIPMISYRDAVWPEVESGKITWRDISPDEIHPNDRGHKICAELISMFLESDLKCKQTDKIPSPLFTDVFEHAKRFRGENLIPSKNKGWKKNENGWMTEKPGGEIVFDVPGELISLLFYRIKNDMGMVEVTVDGKNPVKLDGCFYGEWDGGHTPSQIVGENLKSGMHKVRIKLLAEKAPKSKSNKFEIREIMAFGVDDKNSD